jgi:site-specific recombinase XerD
MFKDTGKWVSSGCHTIHDAELWAESIIRNKTGIIKNSVHEGYRLVKRKGRNIQVMFNGTERWVSTGFDDELNAVLWANAQLIERKKKDITLGEFSEGFYTRTDEMSFRARNERRNRHYGDEYYNAMDGRHRNYIIPTFGEVFLSNINHIMIDSWFVNLKSAAMQNKELAADTKNKILQCLSNILTVAVAQGVIDENPCDKVEKNAEHNEQREPLTPEEMEILFPENDNQAVWVWGSLKWACYFHIMKSTGFRPGEIAGLERKNYHPELGGVYTTQSINSQKRAIADRIKTTDKGVKYKVGILSDQCCRLLNEYIKTIPNDENFLFKMDGEFMQTYTSNKHFKSFAKKAGIDLRGRTQYSLRHTFQTMIAGEIEKSEVEELMGHTKYRKGYDHRDGKRRLQQLQSLRNRLNSII